MELVSTYQQSYSELQAESFDVFIMAAGHQSRCRFLFDHLQFAPNTYKYLITYDESFSIVQKVASFMVFRNSGFKTLKISNEKDPLHDLLVELETVISGYRSPRILVDYSIMPKLWYSHLINFFARLEADVEQLTVSFSYTPPEFMQISPPRRVKTMHPLNLFRKTSGNNKPTALILGLGCEKDLATMVNLKIRPEKVFAFLADPSFDHEYTCEALRCNRMLLDTLHPSEVVHYPANDHSLIDVKLTALCLDLRLKYKVVIVPLGPKTFTLNCLLLAIRYPDIELWEVITEKSGKITEGKALAPPIVLETVFKPDEE